MERMEYNQLMSGAKYKPGDVVWTNDETLGVWPGKVLHVPDEILEIYPDVTRILHYVELYAKKERDFYSENELWLFKGQSITSSCPQVQLFSFAIFDAKADEYPEMTHDSEIRDKGSSYFSFELLKRRYFESAEALEEFAKSRILDKPTFDVSTNSTLVSDVPPYAMSKNSQVNEESATFLIRSHLGSKMASAQNEECSLNPEENDSDMHVHNPHTQLPPESNVPSKEDEASISGLIQNQDLSHVDVKSRRKKVPVLKRRKSSRKLPSVKKTRN